MRSDPSSVSRADSRTRKVCPEKLNSCPTRVTMALVPCLPSPSPPPAGAVLERRLIATPTPQGKATPTSTNRTAGRLLDCPARRPRGFDLFINALSSFLYAGTLAYSSRRGVHISEMNYLLEPI